MDCFVSSPSADRLWFDPLPVDIAVKKRKFRECVSRRVVARMSGRKQVYVQEWNLYETLGRSNL